jgi:coenzyme F420 hydrogenase subunit beta
MRKNSIADITESKLCCSCGACGWACPEGAISYVETVGGYLFPSVDLAICTDCGVCRSVCPGIGLAPVLTSRLPCDPFCGTALKTYVGKASDGDLYTNSQSGGIVSALLCHALQTGKIGGAVTTVMVAGNPPRAKARLAKSFEEIREAQKSKYCPVPLLSILDEIEEFEKPVAVVGVGCQVHGLNNLCERFQSLKDKIAFTIGLICDRTMTYGAIDYLLKRANISSEDSKILHFRDKSCGGYPGNVNLICSSGDSVSLLSSVRKSIKDFFTPARCRICFDKMNVLSDITVGDPWGITEVDSVRGESVAVVRTDTGRRLFQNAIDSGAVTVREIEYKRVLVGQCIERKRVDWRRYSEAWNELGRPLPSFYEQVRKSSGTQHRKDSYQSHLQHALALNQYPSREALVAAAEKTLLLQKVKEKTSLPLRAMKRILRRISKNVAKGACSC